MISDLVNIHKDFYTFNQAKFRPLYSLLSLNAISLYIKSFCHLVNVLTNKTNICTKEKS